MFSVRNFKCMLMDTKKIIFINALKIYIGIVLYFFFMKLLRLDAFVELRSLNFLFVVWGVNTAIKKNVLDNLNKNYLPNLSIGFVTSFLAVLMVIISLVFYISYIDQSLLKLMESSLVWGSQLSLAEVVFAIAVEGAASSIICAFITMQYWKSYKFTS